MQFVDTIRSEYIISPECKKLFIETANYTNVISTQKLVTIIYTTIWLNPNEKSDVLEKEGAMTLSFIQTIEKYGTSITFTPFLISNVKFYLYSLLVLMYQNNIFLFLLLLLCYYN